jgi:hypothetical protein
MWLNFDDRKWLIFKRPLTQRTREAPTVPVQITYRAVTGGSLQGGYMLLGCLIRHSTQR